MTMHRRWLLGVMLCCLPLGGCATNAGTGATIGGLTGAAAGGLIGSRKGNALPGAVIGGALGAAAGGLIGHTQDKIEEKHKQELAAVTPGPMTINNVINLTQQGVSEDIIINQIRSTGSVFMLTDTDLVTLKQYNVSDRVIQVMQDSSRRRVVRPVVIEDRPVIVHEPPPVVIVRDPPPPPIGVGFHYYRRY
jgi:hypothetical protein